MCVTVEPVEEMPTVELLITELNVHVLSTILEIHIPVVTVSVLATTIVMETRPV